MSPQPWRALIYNRVSSDPAERRISTASQDRENRAYCEQQGWEVVATVTDDDRSASRHASRSREGFEKVLRALDGSVWGRIDVLVTWEASRRERDLSVYVALRDRLEANGVRVAYKGRLYDMSRGDDRFTTGLDALLAEREAEEIRERILRSHRHSAQLGTPRGIPPYGYQRTYDPASGRMIGQVPDPVTSAVVKRIVRRILAGDSLYAIVADLNRAGVPTPRAYRNELVGRDGTTAGWSTSNMRQMLAKQSLIGIRIHRGLPVGEATWDPIVDPGDWQRVQQILNDPLRVTHRGVVPQYLLSGIALCGVCGAQLRQLRHKGRETYRCEGLTKTSPRGHVSRGREVLDRFVERPLLRRLSRPDVLELFAAPAEQSAVAEAQQELASLEARLAEFQVSAAEGGLSPASFGAIEARLLERIAEVRARAVPREVPRPVLELAAGNAVELWERWGSEPGGMLRKRQVVRALLRIRVHRAKAGVRGFDPTTVELVWRGASGASGGVQERSQ